MYRKENKPHIYKRNGLWWWDAEEKLTSDIMRERQTAINPDTRTVFKLHNFCYEKFRYNK